MPGKKKNPLWRSFGYAFAGIWTGIRKERNMKIHCTALLMVVIAGIAFRITVSEWCICIVLCAFVMSLELVNTAVEAVVDLVSPNYHPLAKVAKDCAAGAVLVAALGAVGAAVFLFGDATRLSIALGIFVTTPWMWGLLAVELIAAVVILLIPGKQSEHAALFSNKHKSEKKEL